MKETKKEAIQDNRRKVGMPDFRNTKSSTWNSKRRFGI